MPYNQTLNSNGPMRLLRGPPHWTQRHMINLPVPEALTFDDVLLVPAYSEVIPTQVSTATQLCMKLGGVRLWSTVCWNRLNSGSQKPPGL